MKKFFYSLVSPTTAGSNNITRIYNRVIAWMAILTIFILLLLAFLVRCNLAGGLVTFLLVAAASFAGGAAIGFLFGLPRAGKYRFIKKEGSDQTPADYAYADNTNLEEVSDWLTKIIVGLTLIKLHTILSWIDQAAKTIQRVYTGCEPGHPVLQAYVFGYCTIILYFLAGAGLCYLWARTNLSLILTLAKIEQAEAEKKSLLLTIQKLTNKELLPQEGLSTILPGPLEAKETEQHHPGDAFLNKIFEIYESKRVYDKDDLQRGRWGGKAQRREYRLEAGSIPDSSGSGLYGLKLSVRCTNSENKRNIDVAFFLHDTFASQIVFTVMSNNIASLSLVAYEAFVVGARTEDGVELELDLNTVEGFPPGFYWKE